ncbi:MAG: HEAT repeat domain-containing protein [Planctomycetota bacterium]
MRHLTILGLTLLPAAAIPFLFSLSTSSGSVDFVADAAPPTGPSAMSDTSRRTAVPIRRLRPVTLTYSLLGELHANPRSGKPTRVGLAGAIVLGLTLDAEGIASVEADFSDLQVLSVRESGEPLPVDEAFVQALRSPVRSRWAPDAGTQVCVPSRDRQVASVQRAVLDALAGGFVTGPRITGEDAFGAYDAEIATTGDGHGERHKLAYRRDATLGACRPRGKAGYVLDPTEGWPLRAEVDESCDIDGDACAGTYTVVLTATLRAVGGPPQTTPAPAGPGIHRLIVDLADLLAAHGLGADETRQAWERLIAAVAGDPALTDALLAQLPLCADTTLANLLLSALGAAGHERAQSALIATLRDAHLPPQVREGAAVAMVQIQTPSDTTLAELRADAMREVGDWNGPGGARLLAWGTLAGRSTDTAARVAEILALDERARALGAEAFWLEALGNTGHPSARDAICARFDAADPMLRFAAASAARSQRDADTTARLARRLSVESESEVRRQLVASLAERDDPAVHAGLELALRDEVEGVRRQAILVAARSTPERAALLLARAAQSDVSADLRELAARLLAGLGGRAGP